MKTDTIAFRLIAGAALWLGLALVVSGFVLAGLFVDHVERGFDRRISILLESLVAVAEISPAGDLVIADPPGEPRFRQPYSGWYWQIDSGRQVRRRSPSLWDDKLSLATVASDRPDRYEIDGPNGHRLRVVERVITLPGSKATFNFAVAADAAELEAEIRPFTVTLAWSLGALWAGLIAAAVIQVRFGLSPMRRIRAALSEVRAGCDDRLHGEFPAEVRPLVDELNAHLGQIDEVVARARTHVGNLAHALKTPLSVLGNEAERGQGPLAETVKRLRHHGQAETYRHTSVGGNFRMDALQAAVLRVRAGHLDGWTRSRRENAVRYRELFEEAGLTSRVVLPVERPDHHHVFNQYVIRVPNRDRLKQHLETCGIGTAVYYPLPLHLQPCFADLGHRAADMPHAERAAAETLALPIFPGITLDQQRAVVGGVSAFLESPELQEEALPQA